MTVDHRRRRRGVKELLAVLCDRRRMAAFAEAEWDVFLAAADRARLLPRLAIEAERLGLTSYAPSWACDRLRAAAIRGTQYEREIRREIAEIQQALRPAGVEPVFLKGASYVAAGLAAGAGRVVADVDILVAESDLNRSEAALERSGWGFGKLHPYDQRYYREWMHELPPMRHRTRGTVLDVHHRILPRTGRVHPPTEQLLRHAQSIRGTKVLSPPHMALHSAAHMFQDGEVWDALRDLVDLRDLIDGADFESLVSEADRMRLGRALFYAVRYAKLVGGKTGDSAVARWRPAPAAARIMDMQVEWALTRGSRVASNLLYLRSHWLKMPPIVLLRHLATKALTNYSRRTSN